MKTTLEQATCPECQQPSDKHYIDMAGECLSCMNKQIHAEMDAAVRKDRQVLAMVKLIAPVSDHAAIDEDIKESSWTYNYNIVEKSKVKGEEQDDVDFSHGYRFVDQTTNGGMTGDDFAGDVYIPVSKDQYFKYSYHM